ncbi:MAG: NADPH:quinone oxidoreductase [Thermoleophilia bacterium]|nr:NADPH:quinone oxidoreductase [Thermoleophilia bacterium]
MPDEAATPRRPIRMLVFSASHREGSLNTKLALQAREVLEGTGVQVDYATMQEFDCPSYDGDVEAAEGIPAGAVQLRDRLEAANAFVIVSPEYNASMPGHLKNAIDWTSRHRPQPFQGRHCLLMSASPSMVGGNRGLWSLRIPLEHLGAPVYPDMFSFAQAHEGFDEAGAFRLEMLRDRFTHTLVAFADQVEASTHYPCAKARWVEFLGEPASDVIDRVEQPA